MITPETIVDLHIHSCASDSSDTPEQIVNKLIELDIGIASLTDHNSIMNVSEFISLAEKNGIKAIPGVEINAKEGDTMYHILAYCFDPGSDRIRDYVGSVQEMMDYTNRELIIRMSDDYEAISISEYDDYEYDRTRGGWIAINYLMDKGITTTQLEGLEYYERYDCQPTNHAYPPPVEVIKEILEWGAYPVLAHPNYYMDQNSVSAEEIKIMLDSLKALGLLGVECYYPTHNELMTTTTLDWCTDNDMIITAGCDGHGTFVPGRGIGKMRIPYKKLNISKLIGG